MFRDLIATIGTGIGELWCKALVNIEAALDDHSEIGKPYIQTERD